MKSSVFQTISKDIRINPVINSFMNNIEYLASYGSNLMTLPRYDPINVEFPQNLSGNHDFNFLLAAARRPFIEIDVRPLKVSLASTFAMSRLSQYISKPDCPIIPIINGHTATLGNIRRRQNYETFPYRVDILRLNLLTKETETENRNITEEKAQALSGVGITNLPDVLGFWNYITNELYVYSLTTYIQEICDAVQKSTYYSYHHELSFKPNVKIEMGVEEEWLFLEKGTVIPAHKVFLNVLNKHFGIDQDTYQAFLDSGHRNLMNELFNHTTIGTDGRRIIAETRSKPFHMSLRNLEFNHHRIGDLYKQLQEVYQQLYTYGYEIQLGGGRDGETISSHFNFSGFRVTENLIKLWNIYIGKLLQDMEGGERPDRINPPDRFTTNYDERQENHYGHINNRSIFDDQQIRQKVYGRDANGNDKNGFEWRVCPAVFLNKTFTQNVIKTIWYFLTNDEKDFPITPVTLKSWEKAFDGYVPAWEFYFMTQNLSLLRSPFDYNIPERKNNIRSLFHLVKTARFDKVFNEPVNLAKIREHLLDYLHHPINIKLTPQKNQSIMIHPQYLKHVQILFSVYKINIPIKTLPNDKAYLNSFFISGNGFTEKDVYRLCKVFCLVNGGIA